MWKPNTDLAQAEEKFKELAEAYSILSNADKRKHYDLEAWIWMSLAMSDSDSVCHAPGSRFWFNH